ncbi:hypothetical protein [Blautia sp.]|uniref:hypothetical protein n=1 Tax=Blautia sp. TaxID=1955243 RepID=UPI003AB800A2
MKKKQLFAVLLAGSMTVGMAPAAAFAAEDTGAVTEAEASTADENTETPDDGAAVDDQSQSEADAQAEAEAQAAAQAQAEAEAQAQAEAEAQAAAQAQAEEAQQEQQTTAADATVTTAEELQAAINNAPDFTGSIDDSDLYTSAYKILISASFNLTDTITVPAKKNIAIFGATDATTATTVVGRGSVAGDMFKVSAGSILSMTQNEGDGSSEIGKLSVEGNKDDGTAADGSIVSVEAGAKFVMTTGVTLSKNVSTAAGAAVKNSGKLVITGGEIKDNVSTGGAVYSTGTISLEQGTNAAADEPKIIENYTSADKSVKSNIVLGHQDQNAGSIIIAGAFENSNLGYSVENPAVDYTVFQKPESLDVTAFEKAVNAMSYEGDQSYAVDTTSGKLVSKIPVVRVTAQESEKENTVSVKIESDKAGTYFYKYVKKDADAPKFDKSAVTPGVEIEAKQETSFDISGITDKSIDLYVWVETKDGFVGAAEKQTVNVKQAEDPKPVATAPTITKASFKKWNSISEAVVTITSDKEGQYYYKLVKHGTKVSKSDIDTSKAGKKIAAKTETQIKLSKLNAKTSYDVYVVVKNSAGVSNMKQIALDQSKRPTPTPTPSNQTKASLRWTGYSWRDHSSATVTCVIGADGICNYTWKIKGSGENGGSGKVNIKADKAFNIELNNLPDKEIEVYITAKDSNGKTILLQATIKGQVKTRTAFKFPLPEKNRPKVATPTPNAYIPDVKESVVQGLDEAIQFYPNQFYEFTVIGAGTTNQDPNEGDVKWVPVYWSTAANPTQSQMHTAWKIGSGKGINKDATYNLYVFFQKYVYTGGQWQKTDTIESAVYQFKSAKLTPTGTPGADGSYGGGQTGSDPDATITGEASATSSNGGNGTRSKNAVSTADNSPVGTMSALAVASLLAGGYVIVRRRKKDI